MIPSDLLADLCCPETHQALAVAGTPLIEKLNSQVQNGQLRNRAGELVREKLDGGLLRDDGKVLYPIRHELPILLIDEAIDLSMNR